MKYLIITSLFRNHSASHCRRLSTKIPIYGEFDRTLIAPLVETFWKHKLVTLQLSTTSTIEHLESRAKLITEESIHEDY